MRSRVPKRIPRTLLDFSRDRFCSVIAWRGRGHRNEDHRLRADRLIGPFFRVEVPLDLRKRFSERLADMRLVEEHETVVGDERCLEGGGVRRHAVTPEEESGAELVDRGANHGGL